MQSFSLIVGAAPNDVIEVQKNRSKPAPGDQLLLLERPLLVPNTNQQFGNLLARITYMRILAGGDVFVLGNAEHRLNDGVISVQGSFRFNDTQAVFSIIGGTQRYLAARGTVTWDNPPGGPEKFTYDWN
jgi:hypothetical protein